MKAQFIILLSMLPLMGSAQKVFPRLTFEIGGGYEYAHLNTFNETIISADNFNVFKNELHSGFSINGKVPFHFNNYVDLGGVLSFKRFAIKDNVSSISLVPGQAFSGANEYERRVNLTVFEGGFNSAFWVSKLFPKFRNSKLNIGVDAMATYGVVRFKSIKAYTFPDGDTGYQLSHRAENDYFRFGGGVNVKYNFEKSIVRSAILKVGYTAIVGSFDDIDLGGFYARFFVTFGKRTPPWHCRIPHNHV
ncbi:MAG: hypothetical protein ACI857_002259 [Arenicella sp.]|jgi:hypothetical protein